MWVPVLPLLLFFASCTDSTPDDLLVTVNFYRSHNIGSETPPSGVLRLTESGGFEPLAWHELITSSVAVDGSGRYVYLACGNGILVSRDGGRSWCLTGGIEVAEAQRVWIDVRDPHRAYAATAYGLFVCERTPERPWQRLIFDDLFRFCSDVRQDLRDPDILWVGAERGIFRVTPECAERRGPDTRVRRVVQDSNEPLWMWATTDGLGLLGSADGGDTWAALPGSPATCFCVERGPGQALLCGAMDGFHRSDDLGRTWRNTSAGLPEEYFVLAVAIDPRDAEHLCVAGTDGVFESRDGGGAWTRLGLENALTPEIRFAHRADVPRQPWEVALAEESRAGGGVAQDEFRPADAEFEERRAGLLAHFESRLPGADAERIGIFPAVLAARAEKPDSRHYEQLMKDLEKPAHSMFFTLPAIGLYLHARNRLPEEVAARLETLLTEYPVYRGDTENHWVMHYTALLLAAQTFPETPADRWYMGRTSASLYAEAEAWLRHWARLAATKGQGEFDSPHYMFMFVTPMLFLYDFAEDPALRQLAGMMLDLLLADYLSESLHGAYCGGHSRAAGNVALETTDNRATAYHYLYAGGIPCPEDPHGWLIPAVLSSYVPPRQFRAMANDRPGAYEQTEVKRVRNVIRFGIELNPPVYKTDYMTPRFCLGSLQGGILQPIQQHTFDVTWLGSAENSTLFAVHPSYWGLELGMFFPEEVHYLTESVAAQKSTYTSPDKWISASPFEKVFQYRNILLALYDVPPDWNFPHVDVHWPRCLTRTEAGGWLFGRDGEFFLACHVTSPGEWIAAEEHDRLRLPGKRLGFVLVTQSIECAGGDDSAFAEFRDSLLAGPLPELWGEGDALTLRFDAPGGVRLERPFAGDFGRADGEAAPFPVDRLFQGPFVNSAAGSGIIELSDLKTRRILDFNQFTIRCEEAH